VMSTDMTQEYDVEVQPDFLERQSKAQPVAALAELVWNALDADATEVNVELVPDKVGGMSKVVISDNGHGIDYTEAPALFKNLGGSWKKHGARTKTLSRMLHGQEGKGRFKAFALGGAVDWKTVYANSDRRFAYDITILESNIRHLRIGDEKEIKGANSGTIVVVSDLKRNFVSLRPENSLQELSEIFALYLKNYKSVVISVDGQRIDPALAIARSSESTLTPVIDDNGTTHPMSLEVIEWNRPTKRALYLCNEQGFPLSQVETRFHVGDFHFSAYLKSTYISALQQENRLDLAELMPTLVNAIEEARKQIKIIFRDRAAEKAQVVVDEWKAQKLYPYEGEATNALDKAGRQIFDIVAVTVQEAAPEFSGASHSQMSLHLQMLRHAIERSPSELQKILDSVLNLPKRKQKELATLLDETDLPGIISAATLVADRLKFLQGLRFILFDYEAKQKLKERSQLHKILEQNTWLFGEEYNLWASDKDLTSVLKAHKKKLDPSLVIDEPVRVINKVRGIVDLMLSRKTSRHRADDFEHLVIELKAPKVTLDSSHLSQLEGYALAVMNDARFSRVPGVRWHFWLVSDDFDDLVGQRIKGGADPQRHLILKTDQYSVGVKTWGEILDENNSRLQFIKDKLEHNASDEQALAHLQERHKEFLEGVIVEEDDV
jgi:hypothetical protein